MQARRLPPIGKAPPPRCPIERLRMSTEPKKGDHVEWRTPQGTTRGTVVKKVTGTAHAKGHTAKASAQQPQYEVKSDKTGATAIHKPASLKKSKGA